MSEAIGGPWPVHGRQAEEPMGSEASLMAEAVGLQNLSFGLVTCDMCAWWRYVGSLWAERIAPVGGSWSVHEREAEEQAEEQRRWAQMPIPTVVPPGRPSLRTPHTAPSLPPPRDPRGGQSSGFKVWGRVGVVVVWHESQAEGAMDSEANPHCGNPHPPHHGAPGRPSL